jgi:hypothetical protein
MLKFLPKQNYHRISFCEGKRFSFGIFENMLFVEMESSKLNNYLAERPGEPTIQLR